MTDETSFQVEHQIQLTAKWPEGAAGGAVPVNQAVFAWDQNQRDMMYMMLGHIAPPLWQSPEQAARRAEEMNGSIDVILRGSYVLSRQKAEEIWRALGTHLGLL
ncbi:hypothetical protein IU421_14805 [Nocardia cyriacigeorgica]|uniref:hypothetical protein n=1 Tax=Nocardia cyriacigeorgica TaxID=135487 RepID=UPI001893FC9D|nr:hypothetical protein [Nocardia cyriacigeorgica]MBF6515540.1 hypothetical protein [Nocardia cyriacigeorgica]